MIFLSGWTFGGIYGAILLFIIGLILIIKGGDFFVDAAVWMADVLNIPKFLIGATIVSLATTMPELLVSTFASAQGEATIAVGNAVGSVTANTGLVLSLSALFISPKVSRKEFGIKGGLIIIIGLTMLGFTLFPIDFENHVFSLVPSFILLAFLVFYIIYTIKTAKEEIGDEKINDKIEKPSKKEVIFNILKFVFGACAIVIGAQLLVDNATAMATALHIKDGIIAITIVAIGTSLPELVTTITAIRKKEGELGVGNIIGANIIDLVLILPICSFISGGNLEIEAAAYILDIPFFLAISLIAIIPSFVSKKLNKWQGITMLALYASYISLYCIYFLK